MAKRKSIKQLASEGGRARAEALSPAGRSEIARRAVQARWAKEGKLAAPEPPGEIPYSMFRGNLHFGDLEAECHVLSDVRRVFTQREVVRVLSRGRESGNIAPYLERNPFIDKELVAGRTVQFKIPQQPTLANGYEATLLVDICTKYVEADEAGILKPAQKHLAKNAGIVIRSCAKVGIIALIDEATGFQQIRAKQALQMKLQAFIADEMAEWAKMFPDEFWVELARLEGIKYSPRNRPIRWGRYVMAFVYDAVDKDVGKELRRMNPNPHFLKNHHQWLKVHGREKVNNQLQRVIGVMKTCSDMQEFRQKFAYVFKLDPWQYTWDDWIRPA